MKNKGLTLLEVLIALAIITIAFTAIILSTSENIRNTQYVENKMIAEWVGKETMNQVLAGIIKIPDAEPLEGHTEALGQQWFWKAALQTTPNPKIKKIAITVAPTEKGKHIISLASYAYVESNP